MDKKKKNRLISVLFITLFTASIGVFLFLTISVISNVVTKNNLSNIRDSLVKEETYQREHYEIDKEGYLTVYVKGDYLINDESEAIYIYTK